MGAYSRRRASMGFRREALDGRYQTEHDADDHGEGHRHDAGRGADGHCRTHNVAQHLRQTDTAQDAQQAAQAGKHCRLRQKLPEDAALPGADGDFQADLTGALG